MEDNHGKNEKNLESEGAFPEPMEHANCNSAANNTHVTSHGQASDTDPGIDASEGDRLARVLVSSQSESNNTGSIQTDFLNDVSPKMASQEELAAATVEDTVNSSSSKAKANKKQKKRSKSAGQSSSSETVLVAVESCVTGEVGSVANHVKNLVISGSDSSPQTKHNKKKKKIQISLEDSCGKTCHLDMRPNSESAAVLTADIKSEQYGERPEQQGFAKGRGFQPGRGGKKKEFTSRQEKLDESRQNPLDSVGVTFSNSPQHRHSGALPKGYSSGMQRGGSPACSKKQKKTHFEEYWPKEKVSEGLKRGTLIEGKIRINPKNYEDAYVPLPDGSADVYIPGMVNRNRSLNGDIVAVLLLERESWRVYENKLEDYEGKSTPKPMLQSTDVEMEDDICDGPDVVIEEEETVDLDAAGQPIESTRFINKTPLQPAPATPRKASEMQPPALGSDRSPHRGKNNHTYMSVRDVMDKGSPIARQLFQTENAVKAVQTKAGTSTENEGVNMNRLLQKTGKVVAITVMKHSRAASGYFRMLLDNNPNNILFSPMDSRIPRIMIPVNEAPNGFKDRPEDFTNILFIVRITGWSETSKFPRGTLARSLGEAGQIEPETEAILMENDIDSGDFAEEILACLPMENPWTIPDCEMQRRRDFRKECVFTIDPSTARDLDDALSCKDLGNGQYEVGVHIADVSYFVTENTVLDKVAASRATSVYLVQKVIPMLPRLLCEQLCSLNPDEDRLTFSVVWKMTEQGEILEEWFGRSVIHSCVKLSYDHAQGFIEQAEREWTVEELPPISDGFTVADIKTRVLTMNKMAQAMRKARFDNGALWLDQVKIQFTLNKDTGLPNGYFVYKQRDSNKLVEEFMLLANMAVAHKIKRAFRDKAVLRRHPPPQTRMIDELKETCNNLGYPLDLQTARDIQKSLERYRGDDDLSKQKLQVLVALCSKPMQLAMYFCAGMLADETMYRHYALNVPLYTHFTSPIRRYPDILVHRTLAAALGYCEVTKLSSQELHIIADHCNDKKTNAKRASEQSNDLYFSIFVKEAGPLEEKGMVMSVLDKSFDAFIPTFGVVKRVYCEKLPLESFSYQKTEKRPELTLVWKADDQCPQAITQTLSIFTSVQCVLKSEGEALRWSAIIRRPAKGSRD